MYNSEIEDLANERDALRRERDEARGQAAYMIEAFWLAIADLPHSEECAITTCSHQVECPHVNVDCTCPECDCVCSCWRTAQSKALQVDEGVKLCEKLRDAEDRIEALEYNFARIFAWAVLGHHGSDDLAWKRDYERARACLVPLQVKL